MVWTKLQEVLSSVEDSISVKRSWAAPITASDQVKQREHMRAAQESRVKATQVVTLSPFLLVVFAVLHKSFKPKWCLYWSQILEDMEREFGISCSSGVQKNQFPGDIMESQNELKRQQSLMSPGSEERKVGQVDIRR